jgi:hypothetical protein
MSRSYHTVTAWRLEATCPDCGGRIVIRRRRADGVRFVACAAYPRCKWACDMDPVIQALGEEMEDLREALAIALDEARLGRQGPRGGSVDLSRELRDVIALAHPDRWPGVPLAHEVVSRLTDLRRRVAA